MKEIYDPVYYPPSIQGFDSYRSRHQEHHRHLKPSPSPSSASTTSKGSVLGRFLKLGKSKSDASGYGGGTTSQRTTSQGSSSLNPEDYEVDEFRLSPSVIARGPVEKMVHKANSRRDVSRSHSWIYGSVKLPSDLPFGYGEAFNLSDSGPSGDSDIMEQEQFSRGGGHYLHTHALQAMQIPRCQLDYYCTCDCGGGSEELEMMMMSSGQRTIGGSVRGGGGGKRGRPPCQACAREMAMKYALPSSNKRKSGSETESFVSSVRKLTWKSLKQVVKKRPSIDTLKKMPQGNSPGIPPEYMQAPITQVPFLSPGGGGPPVDVNPMANLNNSRDPYGTPGRVNGNSRSHTPNSVANSSAHLISPPMSPTSPGGEDPQTNYFFPDKKGFYSSCNDIYGTEPPPHVTASVRVRPKRTRQPYEFPSEFGPIPNYEEDQQQIYHSEWDLRHVMSYDVWMNTTNHVKPRAQQGLSSGASQTSSKSSGKGMPAEQRIYHSSGNLHVPPPDYNPPEPTTFRPQQQARSVEKISMKGSPSNGSVKVASSSKSGHSSRASLASLNSTTSSSTTTSRRNEKNSQSSEVSTFSSSSSSKQSREKGSTAIIKRSSILAADVSAYQLLKAQTKKGKAAPPNGHPSQSSSSSHAVIKTGAQVVPQQQQQIQHKITLPNPSPSKPAVDLDDAFSESSDDLSDNAVTNSEPIPPASGSSSSSTAEKSGSRVRIAGQGIRMMPNGNNRKPQKSSTSIASSSGTPTPSQKSSSSSTSRTSTFTSYQNPSSSNHNRINGHQIRANNKTPSVEPPSEDISSEDDVWSDCHTEPESLTMMASPAAMGLVDYKSQSHQSDQKPHVVHSTRENHQGGGVKVTTNGNTSSVNGHHRKVEEAQQMSSLGRATMITFDANKKVSSNFDVIEFEEYELASSGSDGQQQQARVKSGSGSTIMTTMGGNTSSSLATSASSKMGNLAKSADNVVSLSVTRNPLAQNGSGGSGSAGTYIKHSKGQQSGSSSSGKFGALRRRKSRNGPNNPGKLLQETIYEEDVEQVDDFNGAGGGHSVKIMVSPAPPPQQQVSEPKPILKNRERIYDSSVVSRGGTVEVSSSSTSSFQLATFESTFQNENTTASPSSALNLAGQDQIYFDSSISTISTASKKKVQFDQSKVVVCGGDTSSGGESYDEENDDSDQWSDKSDEEVTPSPPNQISSAVPVPNNLLQTNPHHQTQWTGSPGVSQDETMTKVRSLFEEEVARKAAQFAKSRQEAEQRRKREELEKQKKFEELKNANVNNLQISGGEHRQRTIEPSQKVSSTPVKSSGRIVPGKPKDSQEQQSTGISTPRENISAVLKNIIKNNGGGFTQKNPSVGSGPIQAGKRNGGGKAKEMFDNNGNLESAQTRVLNPNSLLFHDTTRIRLNQSRPALHENTFKLNGSPQQSKSGQKITRLKQSNSFRSVSSVPLRPREPPPPPPTVGTPSPGKSLASVPARLQKALSTSTLLSKSTEKLNLASSKSIYGSGGKLLPSKSQISLPMGFTTTSNQATKAVGILGSVESLHFTKSTASQKTSTSTGRNPRMKSGTGSLRSKSLTEKCDQLEKVLSAHSPSREDTLSKSSRRLSLREDIDSKSIEIVTKANDVSEIRIYSSSSALSIHSQENLAYQGIIYESSKTLITTEDASANKKSTTPATPPSQGKSTAEIHYAATDLFPPGKSVPAASQPAQFSLPPVSSSPAKKNPPSGDYEGSGKSVVLIIDNSKSGKKPGKANSPLTYSQPIDTLAKPTCPPPASSPGQRQLPQIPLPSIPLQESNKIADSHVLSRVSQNPPQEEDYFSEPLYDDVINHSEPPPPMVKMSPPPKPKGSLGRKSIASLIASTKGNKCPPPSGKLGELPPLPPPPVPPHRTPIPLLNSSPQGQVVSSTLPCPACPPSLPPPNLPAKNLSEFHNRPIVLQESQDDIMVMSPYPPSQGLPSSDSNVQDECLEEEVDNLYNDIGTPQTLVSPVGLTKSSAAAALASAMKEAFLGAIKREKDGDRRSVHSTGSEGSSNGPFSGKKEDSNLIYDDTSSIISSATSRLQRNNAVAPAPHTTVNKMNQKNSSSVQEKFYAPGKILVEKVQRPEDIEEESNEPLYDDVLNLTGKSSGEITSGNDYHSSNSSDSGTEDLPPPLPTQGPPPLPKMSGELPLLTFPLVQGAPTSGASCLIGAKILTEIPGQKKEGSGKCEKVPVEKMDEPREALDRTRSLLNELNEKLSKLNFPQSENTTNTSSSKHQVSSNSASSPGSSSFSSGEGPSSTTSSTGESQLSPEFSTYISKVVISPSSESSGVEEDYNSEKNYSLSNGSEGASSSDENYKMTAVSKLVSETISLARGKFLENMKLSMLSSHQSSSSEAGPGLLMMTSNSSSSKNPPRSQSSSSKSKLSPSPDEDSPEEEPIYEEIGENRHASPQLEVENRSPSPVYADAFDAKSMFDGASRSEILSFLESIRDRLTGAESTTSSESQSSSISSKKDGKLVDVADPDSSSSLMSSPLVQKTLQESLSAPEMQIKSSPNLTHRKLCPDCNISEEDPGRREGEDLDESSTSQICHPCNRKRNEKKEIIMEIYETELKYGRDLKIVSEEFYKPIHVAGLLTKDQLDQIFLNVEQLIHINFQLTCRLKQAIQQSSAKNGTGKDDALEVNVGKIFLELGQEMMTAFENYCTRQASAGALLSQLEKEKELLRIFLRVSQMENTVLRRMNLPAFLMVPVQRVTRYPLLLSRLLKVTPVDHSSREELQSAQEKIEQHLEHMNKTTREVGSVKLWRRISIINGNSNSSSAPVHRRSNSDLDSSNIRIRKMAMDVMDWSNFNDVTCVIDTQLGSVHFNGKTMRNIYGCLLARGKDLDLLAGKMDHEIFFPPAEDVVKDVKLVLVRVKNTRFCLLREPLCLSKCVVSQGENEFQDFIEINEITTKNTYFIQGLDKQGTSTWLKFLQCYSSCVGHWRRRRPALANIMMNGMAIKNL